AVREQVLDADAVAGVATAAHAAVETGSGELTGQLERLVTARRHADCLGRRLLARHVGVVDGVAADREPATRIEDGARDVLAAVLLGAGVRTPEARRPTDLDLALIDVVLVAAAEPVTAGDGALDPVGVGAGCAARRRRVIARAGQGVARRIVR